jgi:hypothetical protein
LGTRLWRQRCPPWSASLSTEPSGHLCCTTSGCSRRASISTPSTCNQALAVWPGEQTPSEGKGPKADTLDVSATFSGQLQGKAPDLRDCSLGRCTSQHHGALDILSGVRHELAAHERTSRGSTSLGPGRRKGAWSTTKTQPDLTAGRPHQPGRAASSVTQGRAPCGFAPHCISSSTSGAWALTCAQAYSPSQQAHHRVQAAHAPHSTNDMPSTL